MIPKKTLGRFGEKQACRYLEKNGYEIIENNYRCRYGEIDIIASKEGIIYFIEVKSRQSCSFGEPEESINQDKLRKISLTAQHYIRKNNIYYRDFRFDALSAYISGNKVFIKHLKDIIQF